MQDRYLCKARPIGTRKQWVTGFCAVLGEKTVIIVNEPEKFYDVDSGKNSHGNKIVEVIPKTVCWCTGLKDKNGNLIWENDIVAYWDSYSTESGLAEADCIGKVVWDDETISFQVTNRLSAESYEVLGDECSVIGNVFDNPELLEE